MGKSRTNYGRTLQWVMLGTTALACAPGLWRNSAHAAAITTTWDGSTGDWFDPSHWSSGVPNNSSDTFSAIINNGTVSLNASATISALSLLSDLHLGQGVTLDIGALGFSSTVSGVIQLDTGSLFSESQNITLGNSTISGDGTYQQIGGTLTVNGPASVDHLVFKSGTIAGAGPLTINKSMTWSGGTLAGNLLVGASASLLTGQSVASAGTIANNGITQVPITTTFIENSAFLNNGSFYVDGQVGGNGALTNDGLLTTHDTSSMQVTLQIINNGTISGPLRLVGAGTNSGVISGDGVGSPGVLTLGGIFTLNPGSRITSTSASVASSRTLTLVGESSADHLTFFDVSGSGTLDLSGPNSFSAGGTITTGLVHVLPTGILSVPSGGAINGALTNDGVMHVSALIGTGTIINSGILDALTSFVAINPHLYNTGTVTVTAPLTLAGSGSSSGMFVANSTTGPITFGAVPAYILDNATLSGPSFYAGTVALQGANTVTNSQLSFTGTGSMLVTGTCYVPSITNGATVTVTGTLNQIGTITAATFINRGNQILAAGPVLHSGAHFINQGVLIIGDSFFGIGINDSSQFDNQGVISEQGGGYFGISGFGTYNSFSNTGTITLANGGLFQSAGDYSGTFITTSPYGILFNGNSNQPAALRDAVLTGGPYYGSVSLTGVTTAQIADFTSIAGPGSLTISQLFAPAQLHGIVMPAAIKGGATVVLLPSANYSISGQSTPESLH